MKIIEGKKGGGEGSSSRNRSELHNLGNRMPMILGLLQTLASRNKEHLYNIYDKSER